MRTIALPHSIEAPSRLLTFLELRAMHERAGMVAAMPALRRLPKGDGHPVIVLPGFTAGDPSTQPLRGLLRSLGYRAYGWRLGMNIGPTPHIANGLQELLHRVTDRRREAVSIVGWSLGGIYGRQLARTFPDQVRQVITLGSPMHMVAGDNSASSPMWDSLSTFFDPELTKPEREVDREPLAVPSSSIYTRTDGIVDWRSCVIHASPIAENIQVYGSHCGLGVNVAAIFAIADRLAQRQDEWQPFRSPLWARAMFPRAVDLEPMAA